MQIIIDKESLIKMLKVTLYVITGADYKEIGEAINELLDKVGYVELPKGHGGLVYKNDVKHKINQDCLTFERDLDEDVNPAKAIMECLIAIDEIKPIIEADTIESEK